MASGPGFGVDGGRYAGLGALELNQWFGVFVPRGTPQPVVDKIQRDIADVLRLPDHQGCFRGRSPRLAREALASGQCHCLSR